MTDLSHILASAGEVEHSRRKVMKARARHLDNAASPFFQSNARRCKARRINAAAAHRRAGRLTEARAVIYSAADQSIQDGRRLP